MGESFAWIFHQLLPPNGSQDLLLHLTVSSICSRKFWGNREAVFSRLKLQTIQTANKRCSHYHGGWRYHSNPSVHSCACSPARADKNPFTSSCEQYKQLVRPLSDTILCATAHTVVNACCQDTHSPAVLSGKVLGERGVWGERTVFQNGPFPPRSSHHSPKLTSPVLPARGIHRE